MLGFLCPILFSLFPMNYAIFLTYFYPKSQLLPFSIKSLPTRVFFVFSVAIILTSYLKTFIVSPINDIYEFLNRCHQNKVDGKLDQTLKSVLKKKFWWIYHFSAFNNLLSEANALDKLPQNCNFFLFLSAAQIEITSFLL